MAPSKYVGVEVYFEKKNKQEEMKWGQGFIYIYGNQT